MNSYQDLLPLFDEVQASKRCHKQHNKKLHAYFNKINANEQKIITGMLLRSILDRALLYPKASAHVDRVLDFLSLFFAEGSEALHSALVDHAEARIMSASKLVRQRICDLLSAFLGHAGSLEVDLTVTLTTDMAALLATRLKDKIFSVRLAAVRALALLQDPEDPADMAVAALASSLPSEPHWSVRKALVDQLSLTERTKAALLERVLDIKAEVRTAVFQRLAEADIRQFTSKQRALIVRSGLKDRDSAVQQAAEGMLLSWLGLLGNDIVKLLGYLSAQDQEDVLLLVATVLAEKCAQSNREDETAALAHIRGQTPHWAALSARALGPASASSDALIAELAWAYIRLKHAAAYQNTFAFLQLGDALLPPGGTLAALLSPSAPEGVLRYLLLLAQLAVGVVDESGLRALEAAALRLTAEGVLVDLALGLLEGLYRKTDRRFPSKLCDLIEEAAGSEGEGGGLEVVLYAAQHPSLAKDLLSRMRDRSVDLIDMAMKQLTSSDAALREQAMQVLGVLTCLSVRSSSSTTEVEPAALKGLAIIKHVACSAGLDPGARQQAILALKDICLLDTSEEVAEARRELTILLHALLHPKHANEAALFPTAMEAAVQLVFNGYLRAPEVVHQVLQCFFIPRNDPVTPQEVRLQQLLSLFISTYLTTPCAPEEVQGPLAVVCEAMSLFVSDFTVLVRDGLQAPAALGLVLSNLMGILAQAEAAGRGDLTAAVFACVCRELLKIPSVGASKEDRALFAAYSKIALGLGLQDQEQGVGLRPCERRTALSAMTSLLEAARTIGGAKPTAAHSALLKGYGQWIAQHRRSSTSEGVQGEGAEEEEEEDRLLRWAAGLSDMLQLAQPYWDEPSVLQDEDEEVDEAVPRRRTRAAASKQQTKRSKPVPAVDEEDEEDDDSSSSSEQDSDDEDCTEDESDGEGGDGHEEVEHEVMEVAIKTTQQSKGKPGELGKSSRRAMASGSY